MDNSHAVDSEVIEDTVLVAEAIRVGLDSGLDWRVYSERQDGRWDLIDVCPTLQHVRWAHSPECQPDGVSDEDFS